MMEQLNLYGERHIIFVNGDHAKVNIKSVQYLVDGTPCVLITDEGTMFNWITIMSIE